MKRRAQNMPRNRSRMSLGASRSRSTRPAARRRATAGSRNRSTTATRAKRGASKASTRSPSARGSRAGSGRTRLSARATIDHDEIRRWVEERGGHPATVKRTAQGNQHAGIIRIDFPGFSGQESLKPVSWEEWFNMFEERQLAFLHQDKTSGGKPSRFNKLVSRE